MRTAFIKTIIGLLLVPTISQAALVGVLILQGIVPPVVAITVTGVPPFNALDLTATQVNLAVANVQEQSNVSTGYKVTLTSANAGVLKNGSIGSVIYTAKYNGVSTALTVAPVTITNTVTGTVPINTTKPLSISYTGSPSVSNMSGAYSDTLTFTISAN